MANSTKRLLELKVEISSFLSLCVTLPKLEGCEGRQLWQVILLLGKEWPTAYQNSNIILIVVDSLVAHLIKSLNEFETLPYKKLSPHVHTGCDNPVNGLY